MGVEATMKAEDINQTLDEALLVTQTHAPLKLPSDNELCYLSVELAKYLNDRNMKEVDRFIHKLRVKLNDITDL